MVLLVLLRVAFAQKDYAAFVNPFIGTGGHGHTFPGATVPFGMVQLSPDTRIDGSWDGCGGYHYSDTFIYGFSHTHLSGTGVSDYGDIAFLPITKWKKGKDGKTDQEYTKYKASFQHKNERAEPGYYSVLLDNGIRAELTSSTRVGMHRYTFPKKSVPGLIVQLDHRDHTTESKIKTIDMTTLEGFRRSSAWAKDQHIYFVIKFSVPFKMSVVEDLTVSHGKDKSQFACLTFPKLKGKPVVVKVGISTVSIEGARMNLEAEIPGWNFDQVRNAAKQSWNNELRKIEVEGGTAEQQKIFYTALYHTMIQPNVAMDTDGSYRGMDNEIYKAEGFTYYSVFSLWDTFRAAHPLYTIIDRKRTIDFIRTFLAQYKDGGRLPVWELASNETDCMIGYHSVSVITDAAAKGILEFDLNLALEAMVKSANWNHLGIPAYKRQGFISVDDEHESVSKSLEYAYDDWCIAKFAELIRKNAEFEIFMKRAQSWKNSFNPANGFMQPKKNGSWMLPFDPKEVNNYFTEANSWQYSFFVLQDINGLINAIGGPDKFEAKLDELFSTDSKTTGREQADITGLIGQYAHGNEPSHHMAYLYNFIDKPWKTEEKVRFILKEFYKNTPDGLIGNEDCGQMSAWYVFSAMGFYPVTPGIPYYSVGSPVFSKVVIHTEEEKAFTIIAENCSEENKFVNSINGMAQYTISHQDIVQGRTITLKMGAKPDVSFNQGYGISNPFLQNYVSFPIVIAPVFQSESAIFNDSISIVIRHQDPKATIYFSYDNDEPTGKSFLYTRPIMVNKSTKINAVAISESGKISLPVSATYHKRPNNYFVQLISKYNPQYTAGGSDGISDGLHADVNWRKGGWQGYQAQDFEAVIDLRETKEVRSVSSTYLQDTRSWIVLPTQVEYYYSVDGKTFLPLGNPVKSDVEISEMELKIRAFAVIQSGQQCRYIKVIARNYGKLPIWHQGSGGDAFIFVDEVEIK